jgi:hypothetical protein
VEPCAFTQKFPSPVVAIGRYLQGETLIEAYWKSVLDAGAGHLYRGASGGAVPAAAPALTSPRSCRL